MKCSWVKFKWEGVVSKSVVKWGEGRIVTGCLSLLKIYRSYGVYCFCGCFITFFVFFGSICITVYTTVVCFVLFCLCKLCIFLFCYVFLLLHLCILIVMYIPFWVLFHCVVLCIVVCKCGLYYCHRVSTQFQLTNQESGLNTYGLEVALSKCAAVDIISKLKVWLL